MSTPDPRAEVLAKLADEALSEIQHIGGRPDAQVRLIILDTMRRALATVPPVEENHALIDWMHAERMAERGQAVPPVETPAAGRGALVECERCGQIGRHLAWCVPASEAPAAGGQAEPQRPKPSKPSSETGCEEPDWQLVACSVCGTEIYWDDTPSPICDDCAAKRLEVERIRSETGGELCRTIFLMPRYKTGGYGAMVECETGKWIGIDDVLSLIEGATRYPKEQPSAPAEEAGISDEQIRELTARLLAIGVVDLLALLPQPMRNLGMAADMERALRPHVGRMLYDIQAELQQRRARERQR